MERISIFNLQFTERIFQFFFFNLFFFLYIPSFTGSLFHLIKLIFCIDFIRLYNLFFLFLKCFLKLFWICFHGGYNLLGVCFVLLYVFMYMYICICIYVHVNTYIYVLCMYMYTCIAYVYVYVYELHMYIHSCLFVC